MGQALTVFSVLVVGEELPLRELGLLHLAYYLPQMAKRVFIDRLIAASITDRYERLKRAQSRTSAEVRLCIIRAQKLSDFRVSTRSSRRNFRTAYSMVANTTANTLPTAMATLYQGI